MNSRDNSNEQEVEQEVEHFYETSVLSIVIIVLMVVMVLVFVVGGVYFLKSNASSSSIKYLTSSTSPGFDLTYTPDL